MLIAIDGISIFRSHSSLDPEFPIIIYLITIAAQSTDLLLPCYIRKSLSDVKLRWKLYGTRNVLLTWDLGISRSSFYFVDAQEFDAKGSKAHEL